MIYNTFLKPVCVFSFDKCYLLSPLDPGWSHSLLTQDTQGPYLVTFSSFICNVWLGSQFALSIAAFTKYKDLGEKVTLAESLANGPSRKGAGQWSRQGCLLGFGSDWGEWASSDSWYGMSFHLLDLWFLSPVFYNFQCTIHALLLLNLFLSVVFFGAIVNGIIF